MFKELYRKIQKIALMPPLKNTRNVCRGQCMLPFLELLVILKVPLNGGVFLSQDSSWET